MVCVPLRVARRTQVELVVAKPFSLMVRYPSQPGVKHRPILQILRSHVLRLANLHLFNLAIFAKLAVSRAFTPAK